MMTVAQSFTWFVDLSTSADTMQVIKVTAGGEQVVKRLNPFFGAYKYFKLSDVKLKFCPAATLPVDPTGLSYEAGESTVDPRDQFNPGLVRITNGENFYDDLEVNSFTDPDIAEGIYYNMMLDPRWYKFQLQSGFERDAVPLYWDIGMLQQEHWPGRVVNVPDSLSGGTNTIIMNSLTGTVSSIGGNSSPSGIFQVGTKEALGWMPTDCFQYTTDEGEGDAFKYYSVNVPPEVELLKIVLPKAYKTKFYYRVYIEETVLFKEPVVNGYNEYGMLDRFTYPMLRAANPTTSVSTRSYVTDNFGNNGDGL